jgi:ectoine hydroxylase-related dioxygenase (phytanoyl-CoA dioxygenase family)
MESKTLTRLDGTDSIDTVVATIQRDGAVIIENYVDTSVVDALLADLRRPFDTVGRSTENDFNGYTTLRVNSVLDISRASAELIGHGPMMEVLDRLLLPHCESYSIGSTTAIEIHPGEDEQVLHRDDTVYPVRLPGMELQVSVMWALTDFTEENGATRAVPGSHLWVQPRLPGPDDEVVQAPMSKGSALFYLGSVFHGGGANRSDKPRAGLVNTYCLGWLRQEVNHVLSVPRDVAACYPEHIQRLMGYEVVGGTLNYYPTDTGRVPRHDLKGGAMRGWRGE